ncbi:cell wall protein DAN4-like [Anarrhichthys ocellatus]|uniref:cell wall protein DAN4-like n=1 Tax=Anarrhichthys ocellatus TaxID=433405 RepID=UPI0012EE6ACC|nr:cell wall protein DAN4-like [Anarrhichthys ocellatus]
MMETKVWIALCALLLVHCGSSAEDHTAATAASQSVTPEALTVAESSNGSDPNANTSGTGSLSGNATTKGETVSVTPDIKKVTNIVSPKETAVPENKATTQPLLPPSPTSHTPTTTPTTSITSTSITSTSITSTTTTAGPTHTTHTTTTVDTPTTTPQTETTHHAALPDSATPSNQPTHNTTLSPTLVPTTEPPKPKTTTTAIITASSISSTSSSQEGPSSEASTLTPPQNTSQFDGHPEASSEAHTTHTVNPPSRPSTQTKPHAENPSQLNVGDDPTMVHDSPTLDPLLAGLVSAFIITAVIITLLLFLKLRRRHNRPEFRRLQDLPMDDMMEDTPLSMYSY